MKMRAELISVSQLKHGICVCKPQSEHIWINM